MCVCAGTLTTWQGYVPHPVGRRPKPACAFGPAERERERVRTKERCSVGVYYGKYLDFGTIGKPRFHFIKPLSPLVPEKTSPETTRPSSAGGGGGGTVRVAYGSSFGGEGTDWWKSATLGAACNDLVCSDREFNSPLDWDYHGISEGRGEIDVEKKSDQNNSKGHLCDCVIGGRYIQWLVSDLQCKESHACPCP